MRSRHDTDALDSDLAALALSGALSAVSASAATLPAGTTAILSGDSTLFAPFPAPVSTSETRDATVSQDGRFVAFQSQADGLYDGDDDRIASVYVKDRVSGAVILASRASGPQGEPTHDYCYSPSISDKGARVAFTCEGSLDPADTNGPATDVYVRDLTTDATYLVSRATNLGAVGNRAVQPCRAQRDRRVRGFRVRGEGISTRPPTSAGRASTGARSGPATRRCS